MFSILFNFIKLHWQTAFIASAAFSVVAMGSLQHIEIAHLRHGLAVCHAENVTLETSNRNLLASVQMQNAAITAMRANEAGRIALSARAQATSARTVMAQKEAAARIIARSPGKNECADMKRLIDDVVTGKSNPGRVRRP